MVGSCYVAGGQIGNWPLSRRVLGWGGNTLARLMLGTQVYNWMAGFKGDSHPALATFLLPAWQRRRG